MHVLRRLGAGSVVIMSAGLGLAIPTAAADPPVGTTVIGDMESAGRIAGVQVAAPNLDHVRLTDSPATGGAHALEFDVAPIDAVLGPDAGNAPAQITLAVGSAIDAVPFTGHEILAFDTMSDIQSPNIVGTARLTDRAGHTYQHGFGIPDATYQYGFHSFDAYVRDIAAAGIDVTAVSTFRLTVPRQRQTVHVVFDTFRLVDQWPYDHGPYQANAAPGLIGLMHLDEGLAGAQQQLAEATAAIPPAATGIDDGLRARAATLAATLTGLRQRIDPAPADPATAGAVLADLAAAARATARFADVTRARQASPRTAFGLTTADSMSLVFPKDLPCSCTPWPATLQLARGESQDTQVVAIPYLDELSGVRAQVVGIFDGHGQHAATGISAEVNPVGSLKVPSNAAYTAITPWVPDPIRSDLTSVDVAAGDVQPYWLAVHATTAAHPGAYRIDVRVSAAGVAPRTIAVPVSVWPFAVPARARLETAISYEPSLPPPLYGITDPAAATALNRTFMDFLEQHLIEPDNIYPTVPPKVDDLLYLQHKWGLRQFNLLYVDPRKFDVNDPASWPAQIDTLIATIGSALDEYRQYGLDKKAYLYGFDESTPQYFPVIKQILLAVRQHFPGLRTATTLRDNSMGVSSGLAGLIDIWIPQMDLYNQSAADAAHARGDQVYWYSDIATGHPYPNIFTGYPGIDARTMMGPMTHRAGVDGYLYYKTDRWIDRDDHPLLDDGIFSTWDPRTFGTNSGDGSIFYPGADGPLDSMRLDNFRDGLQDYNLLELLSDRIRDAHHVPPAELARARSVLAAGTVVLDDTTYTTDPARYRSWRAQVATEIVRLGRT